MKYKYNQNFNRKQSFEYFKEEKKKIDEKIKNVTLPILINWIIDGKLKQEIKHGGIE